MIVKLFQVTDITSVRISHMQWFLLGVEMEMKNTVEDINIISCLFWLWNKMSFKMSTGKLFLWLEYLIYLFVCLFGQIWISGGFCVFWDLVCWCMNVYSANPNPNPRLWQGITCMVNIFYVQNMSNSKIAWAFTRLIRAIFCPMLDSFMNALKLKSRTWRLPKRGFGAGEKASGLDTKASLAWMLKPNLSLHEEMSHSHILIVWTGRKFPTQTCLCECVWSWCCSWGYREEISVSLSRLLTRLAVRSYNGTHDTGKVYFISICRFPFSATTSINTSCSPWHALPLTQVRSPGLNECKKTDSRFDVQCIGGSGSWWRCAPTHLSTDLWE